MFRTNQYPRLVILASCFCLFSTPICAQNYPPDFSVEVLADNIRHNLMQPLTENDPIAAKLNICIGENSAMREISDCLVDASNSYRELEKQVYDRLIASGAYDGIIKTVKESEERWLAFVKADNDVYTKMEYMGTVGAVIVPWKKITVVRQRILELSMYEGGGQE